MDKDCRGGGSGKGDSIAGKPRSNFQPASQPLSDSELVEVLRADILFFDSRHYSIVFLGMLIILSGFFLISSRIQSESQARWEKAERETAERKQREEVERHEQSRKVNLLRLEKLAQNHAILPLLLHLNSGRSSRFLVEFTHFHPASRKFQGILYLGYIGVISGEIPSENQSESGNMKFSANSFCMDSSKYSMSEADFDLGDMVPNDENVPIIRGKIKSEGYMNKLELTLQDSPAKVVNEIMREIAKKTNTRVIESIVPGSQAEKCGLRVGDTMLFYKDRRIESKEALGAAIESFRNSKEKLEIGVLRLGEFKRFKVNPGKLGVIVGRF